MQTQKQPFLPTRLKLLLTICFWAGSYAAIKIAVGEVSPVTVIWLRFLIGFLILGVVAGRRGELAFPPRKDLPMLIITGFSGVALHHLLQSSALVTVEATTTAWIAATIPVFIVLLSWIFLKEKPGWVTLAGILLAACGVLLVISHGNLGGLAGAGFGKPGDLLLLLSAINWAAFSIISRPLLQRYSAARFTFYTMLFGWLIICIPFLAGARWQELSRLDAGGWVGILYLGALCSALGYIFYNDGLKLLPASQVGAFLYLQPIIATLISAVLISEKILPATIIGGALILLGVWQVNRSSNTPTV